MYIYHGTRDDIVDFTESLASADWNEAQGANVLRDYIEGFGHIFPVSRRAQISDEDHGLIPMSCSALKSKSGAVQNCGFNAAKRMFEHLYSQGGEG